MKTAYSVLKKLCGILLAVVLLAQVGMLSACKEKDDGSEDGYRLSFIAAGSGYAVRVSKGDTVWSNLETGAFGVRVSYDEISDVSDVQYAYYSEYCEINGGYLAKATVNAEDGSGYSVTDTYKVSDSGIEIVRRFSVTAEGTGLGFMTYYPIRDELKGMVEDREWFAPGAYYGKDEENFWGVGIKIGFSEEAVATADSLSAPVVANYVGNRAFSIIDRTEGYRETIASDNTAKLSTVMVDEALNIPGIGLKNVYGEEDAFVEMYHCYPANTYNYINTRPFTYNYRMLPLKKGLTRECSFEIKIDGYDTFEKAVDGVWRDAYDDYSVIERRYPPLAVYEALTQNIYNGYGILNNVPQYMTNTDHPLPESGFLYRNVDLAYLMIAAGYRLDKPEYIEQANGLIDYHVAKDLIVDNSVNDIERGETEGLIALLNAYKTHLKNGVDRADWLAFVLKKSREKLEAGHHMSIPLFLEVAEYTKDNAYIQKSAQLLKDYEAAHAKFYYSGAIVNNSGDPIPNRESGMIYMNAYVKMYELTGDTQYLERAKQCELYLESNMLVQNIALETADGTGYEVDNTGYFKEVGSVGNSQVKTYGLSWISGQTSSVDNMSAYSVPDVLKLYDITGDQRYLEFADYLMTNSVLYVNMGDKNWLMDDIRHSSGYGFQNEYFGISVSSDGAASCRGSMHTSNLAWNMFVVLNSLEYCAERDSEFFSKEISSYDTSVLKYTSCTSDESGIYRAYNAVDKDSTTAWRPAASDSEKSITVDLGEYVKVEQVNMLSSGVNKASLYTSHNGEDFTLVSDAFIEGAAVDSVCRYVKITLDNVGEAPSVYDISVLGNPVVAKNYALGARATVSGEEISGISDWNYSTSWRSDKQTDVITFDLGSICKITEVSIAFKFNVSFIGQDYVSMPVDDTSYTYKIEYSNTGDSWKTYVDRTDAGRVSAVFKESRFVNARYFRITATASKGNLTVTELKISGV